MDRPALLVVAGCNGSGKSSYSSALTPDHIIPFDYDKHYLSIYEELVDIDIRREMAHKMARNLLNESIDHAIDQNLDFCYETNFDSTPMHWPNHFESKGFERNIIYFCLDSIEEAKRRVRIRVENGGHFVPDEEVERRYYAGYKNLDNHFNEFDNVHLLNSSQYKQAPRHILSLARGHVKSESVVPSFLRDLLPNLLEHNS